MEDNYGQETTSMEYYTTVKEKKIMKLVDKLMEPEKFITSDVTQTQENLKEDC